MPKGGRTAQRTVVVGGGWSGLAAAAELSLAGRAPVVFESARQLGGRARSVRVGDLTLDNGQHLLLGACRELLNWLRRLHGPDLPPLDRSRFRLPLFGPGRNIMLTVPPLPAPLHSLAALLTARGLRWRERWAACRLGHSLGFEPDPDQDDEDVLAWLQRMEQPPTLIEDLWAPLCLAALNTPPERASARTFRRLLRETLSAGRNDSDLLLSRVDLGRLFPLPAADYVESRGGRVRIATRITSLLLEGDNVRGVVTGEGETVEAAHVVLALPPLQAARLLRPHSALASLAEALESVEYQPITTVYLRYAARVRLPHAMIGLNGTTAQWLFRPHEDEHGTVIAAVISGSGPHMDCSREVVGGQVADELAQRFPHWPEPADTTVLRERRATFACHPGIETRRPPHRTAVTGLWLAGDYTAAGYPATLEGAVRSGVECARLVDLQG